MLMRIWGLLLLASVRSQMAYRTSFLLELVGRFGTTSLELVGVFVLFTHIDGLAGFGQWEVVYLYGIASLSLGIAELGTDGLKDMPELVRTGGFDVILVRPVPPLIQVLSRQCRLLHLGRVGQGGLALLLALAHLDWDPSAATIAMIGVNVGASVAVYAGVFIAGGATTIFTVQAAEGFNAFTYGGVQMTQYPLPIYDVWLRRVFLFVVPVGFTSYFPALIVLGKEDVLGLGAQLGYLAPVVAVAFVGVAVAYWCYAVDRYCSTGN